MNSQDRLIDQEAPRRFLSTAYASDDWIAVLLKNSETGEASQRILSVSGAVSAPFLSWLRYQNSGGWDVYVSVNAIRPGRSRTKEAIHDIRHIFLEEDRDGPALLAALTTSRDLPPASYVLHSSPGRVHVFWRVYGFDPSTAEALQKQLARELRCDTAATSCAQMTRLPGFANRKRRWPSAITIEYMRPWLVLGPSDFPAPQASQLVETTLRPNLTAERATDRAARARRFLQLVAPAIAGQHGDLRTFRICCRIVRGFDLSDDEALSVLSEWNARCEPPWSDRDLRNKVSNARKYGREPLGGLLT
jgi:RepB DNA-primase from phage plasmid